MYLKFITRIARKGTFLPKRNKLFFRCFSNLSRKENDRYKVHVLPALSDNYMYILTDQKLKFGIAVDPVEPEKILEVMKAQNIFLKAVLTTHHHFDHAGGNKKIVEMVKNVPVYGGDERIDALTEKVRHDQILKLGDLQIKCLHTPCHTSGHVCYFVQNIFEPICFTGDTMFVAGCGKFFEGSADDMLESLSKLTTLPPNTRCYCGHEYSLNNLKFALSVEPNNPATLNKLKIVEGKVKKFEPSVPTTIEEELAYNPFLRTDQQSLQKFTNESKPGAVMAALRSLKDNFKN